MSKGVLPASIRSANAGYKSADCEAKPASIFSRVVSPRQSRRFCSEITSGSGSTKYCRYLLCISCRLAFISLAKATSVPNSMSSRSDNSSRIASSDQPASQASRANSKISVSVATIPASSNNCSTRVIVSSIKSKRRPVNSSPSPDLNQLFSLSARPCALLA